MNFNFQVMDADPQAQQNPMYRRQSSSTYTYFTEQAIRDGFPRGNFGGGGPVGPEMFRGRLDTREEIQREIEKERIREEIIADEIARKRILEAEVRHELMMEREMLAMRNGGGFSPSFMPPSLPPSRSDMFEPRMMHHPPPTGFEERIAMSLEQKYGVSGHHREIRGFEVVPFQRFGDSPKIKEIPAPVSEDSKKKVIVLARPNGSTLAVSKRKPTPSAAAGGPNGSNKKPKSEWSCAICQVSATSERGLDEHLQGKKHQAKEAALIAHKTGANMGLGVSPRKPIAKPVLTAIEPTPSRPRKEKPKPETFKFWCEMCSVGAFSEKVMNNHKAGKRHLANVSELEPKPAGSGTVARDPETQPEVRTGEDVTTKEDVGNIGD